MFAVKIIIIIIVIIIVMESLQSGEQSCLGMKEKVSSDNLKVN